MDVLDAYSCGGSYGQGQALSYSLLTPAAWRQEHLKLGITLATRIWPVNGAEQFRVQMQDAACQMRHAPERSYLKPSEFDARRACIGIGVKGKDPQADESGKGEDD